MHGLILLSKPQLICCPQERHDDNLVLAITGSASKVKYRDGTVSEEDGTVPSVRLCQRLEWVEEYNVRSSRWPLMIVFVTGVMADKCRPAPERYDM